MNIETLPINTIEPGYNPRKTFDIDELKESIKQHGLLVPLLVRKVGKKYNIVSGECRWRAAKDIGLAELPCNVKELSDEEAANIAFIDNKQRNNLSPIEEARHFSYMQSQYNYTQRELAEKYNMSKSLADQYLQVAKLPDALAQTSGQIGFNHLYSLSKLIDKEALIKTFEQGFGKTRNEWNEEQFKAYERELQSREDEQLKLAARIQEHELTVKQTESEVKQLLFRFHERDEHIKLEEQEKVKQAVAKLRDGISLINSQMVNISRQIESFSEVASYFSSDYFQKIPEDERFRLKEELESFSEEVNNLNIIEVQKDIKFLITKIGELNEVE